MASNKTGIQWTDKSWNPTTGCDKVSPGCTHCYAEALTKRFTNNFPEGFILKLHPERLKQPLSWRTPNRIFVNSMSDIFHEDVPINFIKQVFEIIGETPWHIYQILTKRHERLIDIAPQLKWHENIWMGVSVESQNYVHRVDYLREVDANVRFLSCEPLLGDLELNLTGIDWVIVGGESGNKYRPMKEEWVKGIYKQCQAANVAFFFKQWGGRTPKSLGRIFDGKVWDEMPEVWEKHQQKWRGYRVESKRKSRKEKINV